MVSLIAMLRAENHYHIHYGVLKILNYMNDIFFFFFWFGRLKKKILYPGKGYFSIKTPNKGITWKHSNSLMKFKSTICTSRPL